MSEKIKPQSFVSKVLAFVKGGDDAKLSRFSTKLEKYYNNQIKMRQDKIESLIDKISDADEALNETILNVDLDQINKTESTESYCAIYSRKVAEARAVVVNLKKEVEELEEEIKELKLLSETIFG
jgi:phage shock protein A